MERSLEDLKVEFDPDLREAVVGRLRRDLERHRGELQRIRDESSDNGALVERWRELVPVDDALPKLFGECLAFLEGALARQHKIDNGLCTIADLLLAEISRRSGVVWDRFTILADGEFYASLSDMIRMRFSDSSVWNLPVAAHEFGHYAGPRLETGGSRPFEGVLRREGRMTPARDAYAHEAFADVFATYTLGPAYAFACLLRFEPATAQSDGARHPSSAKRMRMILSTLERMDEDAVFAGVRAQLAGAWELTLTGAGQSAGVSVGRDELSLKQVDSWAREFHGILRSGLNPPAEFDSGRWLRAQQLAAALRNDRKAFRDRLPDLNDTDTLAEVLNAVWFARWTDWEGAATYGRAAFELASGVRRSRKD